MWPSWLRAVVRTPATLALKRGDVSAIDSTAQSLLLDGQTREGATPPNNNDTKTGTREFNGLNGGARAGQEAVRDDSGHDRAVARRACRAEDRSEARRRVVGARADSVAVSVRRGYVRRLLPVEARRLPPLDTWRFQAHLHGEILGGRDDR